MVELLLVRFEAEVDLSEERFRLLDGTVESWGESMAMIKELIPLIPDQVFCVIDGLHWIDDRSTKRCLKELIHALGGIKFKTLFVTTGRSPCLREEIPVSETLSISSVYPLCTIGGLDSELFEPKV